MKYRFTERALESLSKLSDEKSSQVLDLIEKAAEEEFYNHDAYSYVYDNHGTPWDKLDFKENLNYRVFFTEIDGEIIVLDVFDRDNIDYSEKKLYNLLKSLEKKAGD